MESESLMLYYVPMAFVFPDLDPIALHIGPLAVRWYALSYLAGIVAGWRYAVWLAPRFGLSKVAIDDFIPYAVGGIILGGRMGYVLFYNFPLFLEDPIEIFRVWNGGMSFHGGLFGVIAALILYTIRTKTSLLVFGDMLACVSPIGLFLGRCANFINGELYGRTTQVPWGVIFPQGGPLPRHPSQLYEAALEGLILFLILFLAARTPKPAGFLSGLFLCGYSLARIGVELVREPDAHLGVFWGMFSMGQVLSLPMLVLGVFLMARKKSYAF